MPEWISIELKGMRFHAYHGLYPEEKKAGGPFEADLIVSYAPASGTITHIDDTVDYARLFEILKKEMEDPRELLETLAMELASRIHQAFPQVKKVEILLRKLSPPIAGFTGTAGVRFTREF